MNDVKQAATEASPINGDSHADVWVNLTQPENPDFAHIQQALCHGFNQSPFLRHNHISMRIVDGELRAYAPMNAHLIGNMAFKILHGGVAATILDSLGGLYAMGEIVKRHYVEKQDWGSWEDIVKKVTRLATVDMRVDYISPGRGQYFTADATVIRMGRKSCTVDLNMHNDQGVLIAKAMCVYAY